MLIANLRMHAFPRDVISEGMKWNAIPRTFSRYKFCLLQYDVLVWEGLVRYFVINYVLSNFLCEQSCRLGKCFISY